MRGAGGGEMEGCKANEQAGLADNAAHYCNLLLGASGSHLPDWNKEMSQGSCEVQNC